MAIKGLGFSLRLSKSDYIAKFFMSVQLRRRSLQRCSSEPVSTTSSPYPRHGNMSVFLAAEFQELYIVLHVVEFRDGVGFQDLSQSLLMFRQCAPIPEIYTVIYHNIPKYLTIYYYIIISYIIF